MEYAFLLESNKQIAEQGVPAVGIYSSVFENIYDDYEYSSMSITFKIYQDNGSYSWYHFNSTSQDSMIRYNQFKDENGKILDWEQVDWTIHHDMQIDITHLDPSGNPHHSYSINLTTAIKSKSKTVITSPIEDIAKLNIENNEPYIQEIKVAVEPGCYTTADEDIVGPYFFLGLRSDALLPNINISYDNINWIEPLYKDSEYSCVLSNFSDILGNVTYDNPFDFYNFNSIIYIKFTPSTVSHNYTVFTEGTSQCNIQLKWNSMLKLPSVKIEGKFKQVTECYVVKNNKLNPVTNIITI